jgi:nicotinamide-nucleotide amidase
LAISSRGLASEAKRVLAACRRRGLKVATAEFVTYSNEAKMELLGVPEKVIASDGAVSEKVARAMAEGAVRRSRADIAVSVTGIAGPGGATATKPVGLVHLACARKGRKTLHRRIVFKGNRASVRRQSVAVAFRLILKQAR